MTTRPAARRFDPGDLSDGLASVAISITGMITGPKATTAMVFAALLSELLRTGEFDIWELDS